jgi:hypothetical protein
MTPESDPKKEADSKSNNDDFDLASFIQSPMALIGSAMGAADNARKTFAAFTEAVQSLQRSAAAMESILERVDTVVSQIEAPAKVLGPEMERLAERLVSVSDVFDRTSIDQLPELFDSFSAQMMSVMNGMAEIPRKLGPLGELFGGAASFMGLGAKKVAELPAAVTKQAAKKPAAKSSTVKKPAVKKPATKKPTAKKSVPAKRSAR